MNSSIIRLLLTSCFFFLFGKASSQKWIPLQVNDEEGAAIEKEILQDDENAYKVRVKVNGLFDEEKTTDYGIFHHLSFGSIGQLMIEGTPELPLVTFFIAIPPGKIPTVWVDQKQWTGITMDSIIPAPCG